MNAAQLRPAGIAIASITSPNAGSAYNGATTAASRTNSGGLPPGLTGVGQTVGLIEIDNYAQSDLANTLKEEGLSGQINQVKQYPVAGGTSVSGCTAAEAGCGATEALLDIAVGTGHCAGRGRDGFHRTSRQLAANYQ